MTSIIIYAMIYLPRGKKKRIKKEVFDMKKNNIKKEVRKICINCMINLIGCLTVSLSFAWFMLDVLK